MKDQIIEKGFDNELRKYAFENTVTLSQLKLFGKTLEDVKSNSLGESSKTVTTKDSKEIKETQCTRCGQYDHKCSDEKCPGLDERCGTCRKIGHYTSMCSFNQQQSSDGNNSNKRHEPCDLKSRSSDTQNLKRPKPESEQSNLKITDVRSLTPRLPAFSRQTSNEHIRSQNNK